VRMLILAVVVATTGTACGGSSGMEALGVIDDGDVLSACTPAEGAETVTLVEPTAERPPLEEMEAAIADNPDAQFMVEQVQADGGSYEDAVHQMYGQVVGDRLLVDARRLPGFVTGAYARPETGEPFELAFSGPLPDEFDPARYDLGSYGLEVATGASGFDHDAFSAAFEAAREVGIRVVSGSGDEVTGTGTIEVIDATPEQVAAWEQAVEDPSRWCLVRAARTVACDDRVVADARARAERSGEVMPHDDGAAAPTAEAETLRRSYLGLSLEEAEDKAAREGREVRVVIEDGVELGRTSDLVPGRLDLTICQGTVVDLVS
jgi:hypothetical protein